MCFSIVIVIPHLKEALDAVLVIDVVQHDEALPGGGHEGRHIPEHDTEFLQCMATMVITSAVPVLITREGSTHHSLNLSTILR